LFVTCGFGCKQILTFAAHHQPPLHAKKATSGPQENERLPSIFAGLFGVLLGLALLKFCNRAMLYLGANHAITGF
jgi:hypothetical protein